MSCVLLIFTDTKVSNTYSSSCQFLDAGSYAAIHESGLSLAVVASAFKFFGACGWGRMAMISFLF
jgi:hypothetical protein